MLTRNSNSGIGERAGYFLDQAFPGPNRDKRIAQELDISPNMAGLLRKGDGWTVARLDQMRRLKGDEFARFVLGADAPGALVPPTPHADTFYFATDDGSFNHCPYGPEDFAKRVLGDTGCDLTEFALRMFGWILVMVRADGSSEIRYTEGQTNKSAAARVCDWLRDHRSIRSVTRVVDADGDWIRTVPCSSHAAADALARAAELDVARWEIDRLPLGMAQEFPALSNLLALRQERGNGPGATLAAALQVAPGFSSYSLVDGEDVVVPILGGSLGVEKKHRQGFNVLAWPDTKYGRISQRRMIEAREETTLYRINVPIDGQQVEYVSLAMPDGPTGPMGGVVATSVILDRKRLAA